MKDREYLRKRQEIEDRCRRDLEVLESAWVLFNGNLPLPKSTAKRKESTRRIAASNGLNASVDEGDSFSKRDAVRDAMRNIQGAFGTKDVRAILDANHPEKSAAITENQLSSIISRLASMDELTVVRAKAGRKSALYRKKDEALTVEIT